MTLNRKIQMRRIKDIKTNNERNTNKKKNTKHKNKKANRVNFEKS